MTMKKTRLPRNTVATHTVPSGMGGSFPVIIIEQDQEKATVVVVKGDDWRGYTFSVTNDQLKEIRK